MNESILLEALKDIINWNDDMDEKWGDQGYRATEAINKFEDSSGKETGMKKVTQEDLKLCFKEYDGTISHEDFYKGLRAIDFYLPTIYNTFFAGIEFARQSVPPYKEEETIKRMCKEMACAFFKWYVDDPNKEVTKELANANPDFIIEAMYDIWLNKYFSPETINHPYKEEETDVATERLRGAADIYDFIPNHPYKEEVDKEPAQEELWDEYWDEATLIDTDIDSLQQVAGSCVITRGDFEENKTKFKISRL